MMNDDARSTGSLDDLEKEILSDPESAKLYVSAIIDYWTEARAELRECERKLAAERLAHGRVRDVLLQMGEWQPSGIVPVIDAVRENRPAHWQWTECAKELHAVLAATPDAADLWQRAEAMAAVLTRIRTERATFLRNQDLDLIDNVLTAWWEDK